MTVTTKAGRFSRKAAVKRVANPFVVARERNVVRVDFRREPDPPAPEVSRCKLHCGKASGT